MMGKFVEVCRVDELKDGAMRAASAAGREILIATVGDGYYATDSRCSHMGGDLSQGKLGGTIVACPRHGSQFDVTTGRVVRWTNWPGLISTVSKIIRAPRPINTNRIKLEEDAVRWKYFDSSKYRI